MMPRVLVSPSVGASERRCPTTPWLLGPPESRRLCSRAGVGWWGTVDPGFPGRIWVYAASKVLRTDRRSPNQVWVSSGCSPPTPSHPFATRSLETL